MVGSDMFSVGVFVANHYFKLFLIISCIMLWNGQMCFENLVMWTSQQFYGMIRHFSRSCMKRLTLQNQSVLKKKIFFVKKGKKRRKGKSDRWIDLRIQWRLINVIICSRLRLWVGYFTYFKFRPVFFIGCF